MHLNDKITFGDGILACMSRNFDIFMSKHLAGQWLLNSYFISFIFQFRDEREDPDQRDV